MCVEAEAVAETVFLPRVPCTLREAGNIFFSEHRLVLYSYIGEVNNAGPKA